LQSMDCADEREFQQCVMRGAARIVVSPQREC
jgi:hypothetical protein